MLFKILVILLLLTIVGSLATGLFYMMKDNADSERMLRALTWRIGLSLLLFVVLMIGYATGLITPGNHHP